MFEKISIIGGDLRIATLAECFAAEKIKVYIYGLDNIGDLKKNEFIIETHSINELITASNYVISGIPFSSDNISINAPYAKKNISLQEFVNNMKNKVFIAGKISEELQLKLEKENNKVVDLLKDEPLTIYNAISTVEGAIARIINKTNITIYKSNILIFGYGRIGKILADRLKHFGANIYCEARKEADIAWINTNGYNAIHLSGLEKFLINQKSDGLLKNKINIIVNTIPNLVLNKELLNLLDVDTFILDLASIPGGIDFEYAKQKKLNVDWYLSVPGKIAPTTSAMFIKSRIEQLGTLV